MPRFQITFSLFLAAVTLTGFVATTSAHAQKPFRIEQRWTIGGTGGWDYMTVDSEAHRLYIAHQTRVDVVDINTGKVIGAVQGLTRTHGVVISPDGSRLYATSEVEGSFTNAAGGEQSHPDADRVLPAGGRRNAGQRAANGNRCGEGGDKSFLCGDYFDCER